MTRCGGHCWIGNDTIGRRFRELEQVDPSVARDHGDSGFGLELSKQLVERMEGRIGVEREPRVGSRFSFELELPWQ